MPTLAELYDQRVAAGLLKPDDAQRAVLPELQRIKTALEAAPPPPAKRGFFARFTHTETPQIRGLYLWGGVGRGKSMLMDMFIEAVDIPAKRRVHFHAFMQEIHHGLHEARKRGVDDAIAPVAADITSKLRLLAFDEMQITDITDAMIVGRLFQKLFEGGVTIVTTSNRVPDDLYKNGLNRQLFLPFIGLLKERLVVHGLDSEHDYRQHRLTGQPVYFQPAEGAKPHLDEIWDHLTGDAKGEPLVLTVNGRTVSVPLFANGVARATFNDLCVKPHGPGDYLALAEAVRVLILEDIPRLSRARNNEAKRLVTLIDALYEAKVRLIASAADEPEKLYEEGEGAFEFERTASRLREMQDARWGQA
ncbi:cell division protein ZapE [Falsirhodobacter sp. 20TX0035]|uniref:cell division protein ZapE n=1 Tax=Falsirhodobacter sp. 20TX0035 TaxID=3022019 RepID=UPI00233067A0|nr:cell division protein ZapE [Falsirhodobacter sp. 20TX0035]MDB6452508.1 cell division protein ZapE [Falsirhodobacter sp. 20TX0035]